MPLNLAPHSRFARRWLFDRNRIGGRKSVCKGLIERLFPAVAFSLLAIGMILIRFALRLGNYFGSPIGLLNTSNRPPRAAHAEGPHGGTVNKLRARAIARALCNYSLHHVASRPAKVGDKLVTTKFNNSITRGFAAVGDPNVAVCLLPGTEVAFEKEIEFERGFAIFSS